MFYGQDMAWGIANKGLFVYMYSIFTAVWWEGEHAGSTKQSFAPMIWLLMTEVEYVIFDVETTGMKPEDGHAIVELAAQRVRSPRSGEAGGREVVGTFDTIVNPERSVDPEAAAVHGITNEIIAKEGKALIEVIPAFVLFCEGATLVAHNIKFDLGFLNSHLKQFGLPPLANPTLDTLELARQKVVVASYALGYLAKHFGIPQPTAHRALADVEVTRELLFKLLEINK